MAQTEAQKRAQKKYDSRVYGYMNCKTKKAIIESCKAYADSIGLSQSKFIELSMIYCMENKIILKPKDDID